MLLKDSKLYLILDRDVAGYGRLFQIAKKAAEAGVDIIQLRDKNGLAKDISVFSKRIIALLKGKIPFILNDRLDLALASGASGVHLGQEDLPISVARKLTGKKFIIGASCQNLEHALKAQREGADYIGFGSVFKTLTKPDRKPMDLVLLKKVIRRLSIPVFAIGGIDRRNLELLQKYEVNRIAVCRSICKAVQIQNETILLKNALDCFHLTHG